MNRKDTLDAAAACVLTDRQRAHGPIENSFGLIASFWSSYLATPVTPTAVADMMTLLKIARAKSNPLNADNRVDAAGYQACAAELAESMEAPENCAPSDPYWAHVHQVINGCYTAQRHFDASTPSDAPAAPQTPPEGDHSQTDAGAQGGAIPDDCDDTWHNPHEVDSTTLEASDNWRLLLKDEKSVPDDAEFYVASDNKWIESQLRGEKRKTDDTYRTRAPLPESPAKAIDAAISAIQETCTAPAATDYSVTVSGDPERDRMEREIRARNLPTKEEKASFAKALEGQEKPPALEPKWHNPHEVDFITLEEDHGWRLLLKDEMYLPGDGEFWDTYDNQWEESSRRGKERNEDDTYRTKAPLPPSAFNALADAVDVIQASRATAPEPQWHNPEMIDPSHLTDGRRFLLKDETQMPGDVEVFSYFEKKWATSSSTVRFAGWTYATRAPLPGAPAPEAPVDHNLHQTTP